MDFEKDCCCGARVDEGKGVLAWLLDDDDFGGPAFQTFDDVLVESCAAWDNSRRRVRFASRVETFAIWESVAPSVELLSCDSDKAKVEICDVLPLLFLATRASSRFGAQSYALHSKADVEQ